nr:immunoglobulin light chain junction region [Macaca mulatta]MOX77577.1 immunoglobulin light chain junction region [Macaca mulatta]MOX78257.1 immunoglobulin light chain junction region [Macaca mulatta]MOX78286.1 immunoglobulin light chain junction region [Macaca mulatta]MOX78428.1 immunoglobulin light chain junction region [Macaca mulatta]
DYYCAMWHSSADALF